MIHQAPSAPATSWRAWRSQHRVAQRPAYGRYWRRQPCSNGRMHRLGRPTARGDGPRGTRRSPGHTTRRPGTDPTRRGRQPDLGDSSTASWDYPFRRRATHNASSHAWFLSLAIAPVAVPISPVTRPVSAYTATARDVDPRAGDPPKTRHSAPHSARFVFLVN